LSDGQDARIIEGLTLATLPAVRPTTGIYSYGLMVSGEQNGGVSAGSSK
jgi:hypothetical protein